MRESGTNWEAADATRLLGLSPVEDACRERRRSARLACLLVLVPAACAGPAPTGTTPTTTAPGDGTAEPAPAHEAEAFPAPHPGPGDAADVAPDAGPEPPSPLGAFEGGPCDSDADCEGFLDCCAFAAQCGNHQQARDQERLCACCVSCPAPDEPATIVPCACLDGRCTRREAPPTASESLVVCHCLTYPEMSGGRLVTIKDCYATPRECTEARAGRLRRRGGDEPPVPACETESRAACAQAVFDE
jgi:hypothetical protein